MTTRLLFRETKQGNAGQRRVQGSHRILVIVIIGVAGVLLLGLLAVPAAWLWLCEWVRAGTTR